MEGNEVQILPVFRGDVQEIPSNEENVHHPLNGRYKATNGTFLCFIERKTRDLTEYSKGKSNRMRSDHPS